MEDTEKTHKNTDKLIDWDFRGAAGSYHFHFEI